MKRETNSYIDKNATECDLSESVLVTKNGVPTCVVEPYELQQECGSANALLKLLTLSDKDKFEGRVFSKNQLLNVLTG